MKETNKMQLYADIYLLLNYCTCFGCPSRPSSGVYKAVVAASGTDHNIWGASFFKCYQIRTGWDWPSQPVLIWSHLKQLIPQIVWSVPEAATTVLYTPDDGRDGRPKPVKLFSSKLISAYSCILLDSFSHVWRSLLPRSVLEAATTVLCTHDDGCDGRPKHIE